MDGKYFKAIIAGISMGAVIACFITMMSVSDIQFVSCCSWLAIVILLTCTGALSVRNTGAARVTDVLIASVVAGTTAAIMNAIILVIINVILAIINESIGGLLMSIFIWTPVALILGVMFPVIGGGIWHLTHAKGLIK